MVGFGMGGGMGSMVSELGKENMNDETYEYALAYS